DTIRQMFQLKPYWRNRVAEVISECRKECDVLVGVHARRGDYKTFMRGMYYYDDADYGNFLKQVSKLFPGKKVTYLICSNEDVSITPPEGSKLIFPKGHFIEDLYS